MADEARCTPLHPENMDATCSDVRELLAPTSFHVVHGGCASVLNVDKALIGQLSPLGKLEAEGGGTAGGGSAGAHSFVRTPLQTAAQAFRSQV